MSPARACAGNVAARDEVRWTRASEDDERLAVGGRVARRAATEEGRRGMIELHGRECECECEFEFECECEGKGREQR